MGHSPPPGRDNHVCHKCGWTFPNPHPSAKHRRAHKKVCGKVEHPSSSDSNQNSGRSTHLILSPSPSDDLSDGDQTKLSPVLDDSRTTFKLLQFERQASNRSEDELFADAVAEFPDVHSSSTVQTVSTGRQEETAASLSVNHVLETPAATGKCAYVHDAASDDQFWSPDDGSFANPEVDGLKAISGSPVDILSEGSNLEIKNPSSDFIGITSIDPGKTVEIVDNEISGVCDSALTLTYSESGGADPKVCKMDGSCETGDLSPTSNVCSYDVTHNSSSNMVLETKDGQTYILELQNPRNKPALTSRPGMAEGELSLIPEGCVQINSCEDEIVQEAHKDDGEEFHMDGEEEVHIEDFSIDRSKMVATEPIPLSCDADQGQAVSSGQCAQLNDLTKASGLTLNDEIGNLAIPVRADQVPKEGLQMHGFPEALGQKVASDVKRGVIGLVTKASPNLDTVKAVDSKGVEASSSVSQVPIFEFLEDETLDTIVEKDSVDDESCGVNVVVIDPCAVIDSTQTQETSLQVDSHSEMSAVGCSSERELEVIEGKQLVIAKPSEVDDGIEEVVKLESEVLASTLQVANDAAKVNMMTYENVKFVPAQDHYTRDENKERNAFLGFENRPESVSTVAETDIYFPPGDGMNKMVANTLESTQTDTISIADGANIRSQLQGIPQPSCDSYQENLDDLDSRLITPVKKADAGILQHMVLIKDQESCAHSLVTTEEYITEDLAKGSQNSWEEIDDIVKTKENRTVSLTNASVDSGSLSDSVEGCWGSVSDGVHQNLLNTNAETADEDPLFADKTSNLTSLENTDFTEALSSMALAEPVQSENRKQPILSAENQCIQKAQEPTSISSHDGRFPSVNPIPSDLVGRNEEIVDKIVNWSSATPHLPLRSLLVEANLDEEHLGKPTIASSLEHEKRHPQENSDFSGKASNSSKEPKLDNLKGAIEREWNSPARLPVNKKDKKKRGKSYWISFICCSSPL